MCASVGTPYILSKYIKYISHFSQNVIMPSIILKAIIGMITEPIILS